MPMIFRGHNEGDPPMDLVATHQRLLIAAVMRTAGPILELGVGWYSTPLLHEVGRATGRKVVTIDNNMDWLAQFQGLACDTHDVRLIGWWGDLMPMLKDYGRFGVVFVDQGQPADREYTVRDLLANDRADVFVMHDTEEGPAYGYNRTLPMFRHQWTDKCQKAWATVASNTVDVRRWGLRELPPVEPTAEVT